MEGIIISSECGDCKKGYNCKSCLRQPVAIEDKISTKERIGNIIDMIKFAKTMGKEVLNLQVLSVPFIGG